MISKRKGKILLRIAASLLSASIVVSCNDGDSGDDVALLAALYAITAPVNGPVAAFSYYKDGANTTQYIGWVERNGATFSIQKDKIQLENSNGVRMALYRHRYLLVADSSTSGKLHIYDTWSNGQLIASTESLGDYPQDIAIYQNKAYIVIQQAYGDTSNDHVAIVRLDTISSPVVESTPISVKDKPKPAFTDGTSIYIGNQDYESKTGSTLSVINPITNSVIATYDTGENPATISSYASSLWTLNTGWFGTSNSSITRITGGVVSTISEPDLDGDSTTEDFSDLAFNSSNGYVLVKDSNDSVTGLARLSTDQSKVTEYIDNTKMYLEIDKGSSSSTFLKVYRGTDGTTSTRTLIIEDLSGNKLSELELTLDHVTNTYQEAYTSF